MTRDDKQPRPLALRALRAATSVVMGFVILVAAIVGLAAIVVPYATGSQALTVETSSMEPTLPPGTMIVVRPTAVGLIEPGDVLTYQLRSGDPTLVTHRVRQVLRQADGAYSFQTQGDNNRTPDAQRVQEAQIRGTVWYSIPYVGWVSTYVTSGTRAYVPYLVLVLLLYAAVMAGLSIRDAHRAREAARVT
ncbi:signal peptidase I [Micrococcales bacterium 31B]|nr:signal peptidase I [Micrococcales bacterium 31B]